MPLVRCIEKGPYVPMKLVTGINPDGTIAADKFIPKVASEYTEEYEKKVHKDKKAMNILFNGFDKDMFDNVINCTTSKEAWDTIQILYEGTEQVRENKMQLLTQQYEHFHFKQSETLSDTFSRFQKLLNALKLYERVYSTKDTNLKLLRFLPNEWKPMTVSLRHSHEFKDYNLEKLYGVLKTYELEIQQDEEIKKGQRKDKSVALVAKGKEEETSEEVVVEAPSIIAGENKQDAGKGKSKKESEDESVHQENLDNIDEYLAFISTRFPTLKFKRNPAMSKSIPSCRRDNQQNNSFFDRSKFKCYNCGIAGHFSNECRKPKTEKKGNASDGIEYKRKYYDLFKYKEKAFVSEEKGQAAAGEDSDEEEFINLALMATSEEHEASSAGSQVLTSNLSDLSKEECKSAVDEISNELYNLHVSLKSLTRENDRIKNTNELLLERNALLEKELLTLGKMQKGMSNS